MSSIKTNTNFLMNLANMEFIKHWNVAKVLVNVNGMTLNWKF
jgi:hypothetical protein